MSNDAFWWVTDRFWYPSSLNRKHLRRFLEGWGICAWFQGKPKQKMVFEIIDYIPSLPTLFSYAALWAKMVLYLHLFEWSEIWQIAHFFERSEGGRRPTEWSEFFTSFQFNNTKIQNSSSDLHFNNLHFGHLFGQV